MIPLNWVVVFVIVFTCIMFFPLILQFTIRQKCSGKLLCAITGKEKPLDFKLLKTETKEGKGEFVRDGKDQWVINPDQVKLVKYPIMWPRILGMFQQIVGCSLYARGRADPLDWKNPVAGALSSKELPAILDPHWLVALVRGVEEGVGGKSDKNIKMYSLLAVAASIMCLLLLFVVMVKVGTIQDGLNSLQEAIKLVR